MNDKKRKGREMDNKTRMEIVAVLKRNGKAALARQFVQAMDSRLDRVMRKHQANVLSDLNILVTQSGAAPGAQKAARAELAGLFKRFAADVDALLGKI